MEKIPDSLRGKIEKIRRGYLAMREARLMLGFNEQEIDEMEEEAIKAALTHERGDELDCLGMDKFTKEVTISFFEDIEQRYKKLVESDQVRMSLSAGEIGMMLMWAKKGLKSKYEDFT